MRVMEWTAFFAAAGLLTDHLLMKYLEQKPVPPTVIFSMLCCFAFLTAFSDPIRIIKGCMFSQSLIAAGYIDHKTGQIPDALCVLAAVSGFLSIQWLSSLEGACVMFAVLFTVSLLSDGIGGGDIKLLTACGWTLGLYGALAAAIITFSMFFFISLARGKALRDHCPLGPYIAFGSIAVFTLLL